MGTEIQKGRTCGHCKTYLPEQTGELEECFFCDRASMLPCQCGGEATFFCKVCNYESCNAHGFMFNGLGVCVWCVNRLGVDGVNATLGATG